jgi:TonB family protein
MVVEAVFWFHPLVWWIGARLVHERERACDEDVTRLGAEPHVYAESIIKICRMYVESPVVCVAGVTGADLKKRIETILSNQTGQPLALGRRLLLLTVALAPLLGPIAAGGLSAPRLLAQSPTAGTANARLTDLRTQAPRNGVNQTTGGTATGSVRTQAMGWLSTDGARGRFYGGVEQFCCPEYVTLVVERIRSNWQPLGDARGTTTVRFTVHRDGRISDVETERSSGDAVFDNSAVSAVMQTGQVPELPGDFPNPTLTVHLLAAPSPALGKASVTSPAQQVASRPTLNTYVGQWILVPGSTAGHIPGLTPAAELAIEVSQDVLTLKHDRVETQTFRRDGGETDLPGYRKGRLTSNDAVLNLATIRVRPGNETVTIVNDIYAAAGDVLVVTRTLRVERPAGLVVETPQNRWDARYIRQ